MRSIVLLASLWKEVNKSNVLTLRNKKPSVVFNQTEGILLFIIAQLFFTYELKPATRVIPIMNNVKVLTLNLFGYWTRFSFTH